ncbi:STE family protein kinase [Tritrichomonas foetus]|uniref:STE family protein kinase n=1 Tax=Tritrichomonas foetus TaxID=1144522 RepID=A0A1J4JEX5_9EUKA|nr:STE family protein kinase [Tritrichomonas foetus]|eukprot:OHS96195.1 STE family protein kinase [Tritrichomonas foetus]
MQTTFPQLKSQYQILHKIGEGEFSEVFIARCVTNNKIVSVKTIDLDACRFDLSSLRRILSMWLNFRHPNVVRYYGSFVSENSLWIINELIDCGPLSDILKSIHSANSALVNITELANPSDNSSENDEDINPSNLSANDMKDVDGFDDEILLSTIFKFILEFLVYFHRSRNVYRELMPKNIFLSSLGDVKLNSLREASSLIDSSQAKSPGNGQKAPHFLKSCDCKYKAPEVLNTNNEYSEKSDIWSLGITAIELATGKNPYQEMSNDETISAILDKESPTLYSNAKSKKLSVKYSSPFMDFVNSCLKKNPEKRPTAEQLLQHKFIKMAKDKAYIRNVLTSQLTPLNQRYEISRMRRSRGKRRCIETSKSLSCVIFDLPGHNIGDSKLRMSTGMIPKISVNETIEPTEVKTVKMGRFRISASTTPPRVVRSASTLLSYV